MNNTNTQLENLIKLTTLPYILINKNNIYDYQIYNLKPPIWIRTLNNSFCAVASETHDISLLLNKAFAKSNNDFILLQKGIRGKTYYAIGKKHQKKFLLKDIYAVEFLKGFYRVPYLYYSPPPLTKEQIKLISHIFDTISKQTPPKTNWIIIEIIKTKTKFHTALITITNELDISMTELQKIKYKSSDKKRKNFTILLEWLIPPSGGIVENIFGVNSALKIKEVKKIQITLKPGDIIKHISDIPSRNKTGFIITKGENPSQAFSSAKKVAKLIQIKTSNLIV